jgi:choline kinase
VKAVLLAAGRGSRLQPLTDTMPKCLVPVGGVTIVDRMLGRLEAAGIDEAVVVTGYLGEVLAAHLAGGASALGRRAVVVENDRWEDWGNFYSLLVARDAIGGSDFVKLDADVLLDDTVLPALLAADGPAALAIDRSVDLGAEEMKARVDEAGRIVELNKRIAPERALGESIGVERIDAVIAPRVFDELEAMIARGETHDYYERAYERLMEQGVRFGWADISGSLWYEIDDAADLERAHELVGRHDD